MSSYLTRHTFGQMWVWQATHKDEASFIPQEKYPVLHQAALNACDALDGSRTASSATWSAASSIRRDLVQRRGRASCSDGAAGGSGAEDLRRPDQPAHETGNLLADVSRQRAGLGPAGGRRAAARHPRRVLQVLRLQGSELGLQDAAGGFRQRRRRWPTGRRFSRSTRSIPI